DHRGRYSFGNQPTIAQWNLARLAECLLPLMPGEPAGVVERATEVINSFMDQFDAALLALMRRKLGLITAEEADTALVSALLRSLQVARLDFTQALRGLADGIESGGDPALSEWLASWRARLAREPMPVTE